MILGFLVYLYKKTTTFHDKIIKHSAKVIDSRKTEFPPWYNNIERRRQKKNCACQQKDVKKSQRISISSLFQHHECLLSVSFSVLLLFFFFVFFVGVPMFMSWQHLLFIITYTIHQMHELIVWKCFFFYLGFCSDSLIPHDMKNAKRHENCIVILFFFFFWQWTTIDNVCIFKMKDWWWWC